MSQAQALCDALNAYGAAGGTNTWDDVIWKTGTVDVDATNKDPRLCAAVVHMHDGSQAFYDPFDRIWIVEREAANAQSS